MDRSQLFFYLLGKKNKFNFRKYLDFVDKSQYWSKNQIRDYQNRHLEKIITHAYNNVPYYQKIMNERSLTVADFQEMDDLKKFPIITKETVRQNFNDFLARDYKKYLPMERSTGGTTGLAFSFYNDRKSWALYWATKIRSFKWAGYRLGQDKIAVLAGGSLFPQDRLSLKNRVWRNVLNYYTLPISNLDKEKMYAFYKVMRTKRILYMRGYPSAIFTFAKYLKHQRFKLDLKAVFTTAEMLFDHQRTLFHEVFNSQVFDTYGCGDGMGGAMECEKHSGFHINVETSILEIIKGSKSALANDEGEIVLTSLHDYAMPFIRYAPGDLAIRGSDQCPCGRSLPKLYSIVGRTSDIIELPNGRTINGLSIPFEIWGKKIRQFQIVQSKVDEINVSIIKKDNFNSHDEKQVYEVMRYHCGNGISIKVKYVSMIPLPVSGKTRYIVSKVTSQK